MPASLEVQHRTGRVELAVLDEARANVIQKLRLGAGLALLAALILQSKEPEFFLAAGALLLYLRAQHSAGPFGAQGVGIDWKRMDVLVFSGIAGATGGVASPLIVFTLFPIALLCFEKGLVPALTALTATLLVLLLISLVQENALPQWPWTVIFLPPIVLALTLWCRAELALHRRLASLQDLQKSLRSSKEAARCVAQLAQGLRRASGAHACLVMIAGRGSRQWRLAYATPQLSAPLIAEHSLREIPEPLRALLAAGDTLFSSKPRSWWSPPTFQILEPFAARDRDPDPGVLARLDAFFGRQSLASFPVMAGTNNIGRVIIASREGLTNADVRSMFQMASQAGLILENMWLANEVNSLAVASTKKKISRDLHDGVIQPVIGMKMALEALKKKAGEALSLDLEEIIRMAGDGIQEMRHYAGALKETPHKADAATGQTLLDALKRQAEQFSRYHGIATSISADQDIEVDARTCDEIVFIVKEGLSNIRRHSRASTASVRLKSSKGRLLLQLLNNDSTGRFQDARFFPKSIGERAADLGGSVTVARRPDGLTSVEVELPLAHRSATSPPGSASAEPRQDDAIGVDADLPLAHQ